MRQWTNLFRREEPVARRVKSGNIQNVKGLERKRWMHGKDGEEKEKAVDGEIMLRLGMNV